MAGHFAAHGICRSPFTVVELDCRTHPPAARAEVKARPDQLPFELSLVHQHDGRDFLRDLDIGSCVSTARYCAGWQDLYHCSRLCRWPKGVAIALEEVLKGRCG